MPRFLSGLKIFAEAALAVWLGACTTGLQEVPASREFVVAVTSTNQLIRFNAARPDRLLSRRALSGLQPGEQVLGMDFRAGNDTLYALGSSGRLYTVDVEGGVATAVGVPLATALGDGGFGFDFNPTVDRIRVVSSNGLNLRLHPDTGAVVDADAAQPGLQLDASPSFAPGDRSFGRSPQLVGAAYSYNKDNPKITTNFAIDAGAGTLVTQGTREGVLPLVSPNSGQLYTVGALAAGPFSDAAFDIHVLTDRGFVALTAAGSRHSRWAEVDLATGAARLIGTIAGGESVRAVALETW